MFVVATFLRRNQVRGKYLALYPLATFYMNRRFFASIREKSMILQWSVAIFNAVRQNRCYFGGFDWQDCE